MQKVKIFKESNIVSLQRKINDFIKDKTVVNISFSMSDNVSEWYGAIVLYELIERPEN